MKQLRNWNKVSNQKASPKIGDRVKDHLCQQVPGLTFPINRRHQGLATLPLFFNRSLVSGFQSIGVTKDWRQTGVQCRRREASRESFQSIGVTKD
jgi:hypothetical protein